MNAVRHRPELQSLQALIACPAVSVSVSFNPVHRRSGETRSRASPDGQPSMNAGERPRTHHPPQLESVLALHQVLEAVGAVPGVASCLHPARIRQLIASVDGHRGLPGLGARETIVSAPVIAHRCVTHLLSTSKTCTQGTLAEVETIVSKAAALCNCLAQNAVLRTIGALG